VDLGGKYCCLRVKNFGAIDSFILLNVLFQFTVSASHPVKAHLLENLIKGTCFAGPIRLYFVVLDEQFDAFSAQHYLGMDNTVLKAIPPEITKRVTQFALRIDFI